MRKLAGSKFDIVVTDINTPIIFGLKLVKRIRSDEPRRRAHGGRRSHNLKASLPPSAFGSAQASPASQSASQ